MNGGVYDGGILPLTKALHSLEQPDLNEWQQKKTIHT